MQGKHPPDLIKGRYRLRQFIGSGGMALVYRAEDELLGRDVAIKFLSPDRLADKNSSERFLREARAVAGLSHPGIMLLYDAGREGDWHYSVLEYIPGTDLRGISEARGGAFPVSDTLRITKDILEALAYAHHRGVVHRDVKPANIMITPDGHARLMDFGLAVARGDTRITEANAIVGTVLYMSPEVLAGQDADHRSDLYALGVVIYEMIIGKPPFTGDTMSDVVSSILNRPVRSPRSIKTDLPEALDAYMMRFLQRDPDARWQSAEQALSAMPEPDLVHEEDTHSPALSPSAARPGTRFEKLVRSSSAVHRRETGEPDMPDDNAELLVFAAYEDIIDAVEAERRRLSRQLEDTVISTVGLLLSQANAYLQTLGGNPQAAMAVSVLTTLAQQVLQQSRDLAERLNPAVLESLGLEPALEALANQDRRAHGINVTLALQRLRERLSPQVEMALYRTAQDALDRASRQGHASRVMIRLEKTDASVVFTLEDDGIPPAGDELRSAVHRMEQLGGRAVLGTARGGGLYLEVVFPVDEPVSLSAREMEVVQLLIEGLTNKEIAAALYISPRTVKFHLDNIYSKLGVNTRTEAAIIALRRGWARYSPPETG